MAALDCPPMLAKSPVELITILIQSERTRGLGYQHPAFSPGRSNSAAQSEMPFVFDGKALAQIDGQQIEVKSRRQLKINARWANLWSA